MRLPTVTLLVVTFGAFACTGPDAATAGEGSSDTGSSSEGTETSDEGESGGTDSCVPLPAGDCAAAPADYGACDASATSCVSVTGQTPLGPFTGVAGWAGHERGTCPGLNLFLVEDETPLGSEHPILEHRDGLRVRTIPSECGSVEANGGIRVGDAVVGWSEMEGTVEITALSPRLVGTLSVQGQDWSLVGSFDLPFCTQMQTACP